MLKNSTFELRELKESHAEGGSSGETIDGDGDGDSDGDGEAAAEVE